MTDLVNALIPLAMLYGLWRLVSWLVDMRQGKQQQARTAPFATGTSRLITLPISGDIIERDAISGVFLAEERRISQPYGPDTLTQPKVLITLKGYMGPLIIPCDDLETAEAVRVTIARMAQGEDPPPPIDIKPELERVLHERSRTASRS